MKNNMKTLAFYICYAIMLIDITFRYVYGISDYIHACLNFAALPLLCFIIIDNLRGVSFKRVLLVILTVAIGFASRLISDDNAIMMIVLFVCAFRGIKFDSLVKFSIPIRIISLIALVIMFNLGLTKSTVYVRADGIERYAYGFGNLNNLSTYILSIVLSIMYVDRKRIRLRDYLAAIVGLIAIYCVTFSRTHIIILIALLIIMLYSSFKTKQRKICIKNKIAKSFISNSFVLMALISLVAYVGFVNGNSFAQKIDIATSYRISSVEYLVEKHGISLYGQPIDRTMRDGGHRVLDNSYAYILLYFGPIMLFAMSYAYRKTAKILFKEKEDAGALFMGIFNVAGLMEHFSIEISMNMYLLYLSDILYGGQGNKKCSESTLNKSSTIIDAGGVNEK